MLIISSSITASCSMQLWKIFFLTWITILNRKRLSWILNKNHLFLLFLLLSVFHTSVSRWFLTGVWVAASLLKSPGLFSVLKWTSRLKVEDSDYYNIKMVFLVTLDCIFFMKSFQNIIYDTFQCGIICMNRIDFFFYNYILKYLSFSFYH